MASPGRTASLGRGGQGGWRNDEGAGRRRGRGANEPTRGGAGEHVECSSGTPDCGSHGRLAIVPCRHSHRERSLCLLVCQCAANVHTVRYVLVLVLNS